MITRYILFILAGYLSGSILYSYILPKLIYHVDITERPADHNPGAANVFMQVGAPLGSVCVFLDILKGFAPVFIACMFLDRMYWMFALVLVAPVAGHAFPLLMHGRGGKGISTSFGALLGLVPGCFVVFLLAIPYIVLSLVAVVWQNSHTTRSVISYVVLMIGSVYLLGPSATTLGCIGIASIVIYRHLADARAREEVPRRPPRVHA